MKNILSIVFLFLISCSHSVRREVSSVDSEKFRHQMQRVLQLVADKGFELYSAKNSLQTMLIYNPASRANGVAYLGEIFLPTKGILCEANFFIYEAGEKEGESCNFQLVCPSILEKYKKISTCPNIK